MERYKVMRCRRQALKLTREQFAKMANLDVKLVEFYEEGKNVASYVDERISMTLMKLYQNMDSVTHYKKRILELALELNEQDETKFAILEIGHMMTELGKLQMEIITIGRV